ncbi:MAG: 50S ribosomal protein L10 [Methanobacteriota archaeon]|nr:MAG: 50S ribosomal protein L10 [Euryarchaeota archaeon]|tara:strand:+ start:2345 stop:3361 length:1017 start_codon:yes stop_codon:yes gene_type:complete
MIAKAAPWKKGTISKLAEDLSRGGTIAIIDIHGIPADAMLGMRKSLRDSMSIRVAKKKLMTRAWNEAKLDTDVLFEMFGNAVQPALVQTTEFDSFTLFSELKKTEAGRAAKPGDIAPKDIIVEKQDTGMAPGPIVGDLNSIGIPAKIMKGSVHIQKDTVAIKEGEVFEGELGIMLSKLGINPIVTGLKVISTYENGIKFSPDILDIDFDEFRTKVIGGVSATFNLACNLGWMTNVTMPTLLSKASSEALNVAVEAEVINHKTLPLFIGRANVSMLGLASRLDSSALDDELASKLGAVAAAAATTATPVAEETDSTPTEVEEEEEDEPEEFGGLGDLFG